MDLIDVFGIEFNNNSEKVDQISFLKLGRRKIRVKIAGFPLLMVSEIISEIVTPPDDTIFKFMSFFTRLLTRIP